MKRKLLLTTFLVMIMSSQASFARDDVVAFDIQTALNIGKAKDVLDTNIELYFGNQSISVSQQLGEYSTNKKTNAFGKSDQEACNWAFLSAIKQLQYKAASLGGNAVMNIKSNYKNNIFVSNIKFQCGAGNIMTGVALKGTVVTK